MLQLAKKTILPLCIIFYALFLNAQKSTGKCIVYLSRTQNTKTIAEIIQKQVGATLISLELENPYPEDYGAILKQVAEENESGFLPPLKTKVDMNQYDTIFLGFPTWGMQLPPPVKSFLMDYDFTGKTVIPFNTNAGYGVGSGFETIKALCPNSIILEGFSFKGGNERNGEFLVIKGELKLNAQKQLLNWLKRLHI